MGIVVITNDNKTLNKEPYMTLNKELDKHEKTSENPYYIQIDMEQDESGFSNGFSIDNSYIDNVFFHFTYSKPQNDSFGKDEVLIQHKLEFEISEYCERDFFVEVFEEITKRSDSFYFGAPYELSCQIGTKAAGLMINLLTTEDKIRSMSNQLINFDIALFARGW